MRASSAEQVEVTLSGLHRKPRRFNIPAELGKEIEVFLKRTLKSWDGANALDMAEETIPELYDGAMGPARLLREARQRAHLTQQQVADELGIRQHHLSEMENAKRPIGKEMARRLAEVLECDYRLLL